MHVRLPTRMVGATGYGLVCVPDALRRSTPLTSDWGLSLFPGGGSGGLAHAATLNLILDSCIASAWVATRPNIRVVLPRAPQAVRPRVCGNIRFGGWPWTHLVAAAVGSRKPIREQRRALQHKTRGPTCIVRVSSFVASQVCRAKFLEGRIASARLATSPNIRCCGGISSLLPGLSPAPGWRQAPTLNAGGGRNPIHIDAPTCVVWASRQRMLLGARLANARTKLHPP